jgi:polyisoprenoid-binding protein YceI
MDRWLIRKHVGYKFVFAAVLATALLPRLALAQGQKISVQLDPARSEIHWTLGDVTHIVKGTFRLKGGMMTFDPKTGAAQGQILVYVDSGDSGNSRRDAKMKNDVLESRKYPQAFFHPTRIVGTLQPGSTQELTVEGTFNIHGADHPLTLKFNVQMDGADATATTHFVVPYVAWGMKDPSVLIFRVAKQVTVDVMVRGKVEGIQ